MREDLLESEQVIATYRDQFMREVIDVDDFELAVERALWWAEQPLERHPEEPDWVRLAVERHRREHTNG